MKKILKITATNKFGKYYSWSANMLLWDELPRWLPEKIKMELPEFQIEYENKRIS